MKKLAVSLFLIMVFGAYVIYRRFGLGNNIVADKRRGDEEHTLVSSPSPTKPNLQTNPVPAKSPRATFSPTPSPSKNPGKYSDGQYTGKVADAFYGNIQVKAIIQNGLISDVQFLQFPNDRQISIEISNMAMPILKQEAIQAQNSKVDIVSGATQTSEAFQESLASALSVAIN